MRVQTKALLAPWGAGTGVMRLWAPVIAGLMVVVLLGLPVFAAEGLLTLEEALELAVRKHPTMWDANATALQTQLAWEGHQAQRRLQVSVNTDVARVAYPSDNDDNPKFSSGLTLDRPVSLNATWQLAAGTSVTLSGAVGDNQGPVSSALSVNFNRQLWPNPNLSEAELGRKNAQAAVEELPEKSREAKASALIDTYRRYRALQIQEARITLSTAEVEEANKRYAEVVAQYELGLASAADVAQVELERDRAEASLARAERELVLNRRGFLRDLGLNEFSDYRFAPLAEAPGYEFVSIGRDEAIARALASSADIRSAERNLAAAKSRYEAATKASNLSASFTARTTLSDWDASPEFSAYVVASYDLADGGSADIRRREAELNLDRAQRALDAAKVAIAANIDRRLSDLEWLADQVRFAESSLDLAERTHAARIEQERRGVATAKTVEASRRDAVEARLDYVDAVVALQAAQWELLILLGEELEIQRFLGRPSP